MVRSSAGLALACILVACGQPDVRPGSPGGGSVPRSADDLYFPTHRHPGGPAALAEGRLIERDRCLFFDPEMGGRYLPIWPDELRPYRAGDDLVLLDPSGLEVARSGRPMEMGGGIVPAVVAGELVDGRIPARCRGARFWMVSDV